MENDNFHFQKEDNNLNLNKNLQRILGLANKLNTIQVKIKEIKKINYRIIYPIIKSKKKIN
jgi:hypothetical protein